MTIIATPSPGYSIKSFSVRQGNNNVTVDTDGSFTAPDGDFTVAAEFKRIYPPPAATYYTVTLPSVEGATLSKQAGDHTVEEGYSFTFAITLDECLVLILVDCVLKKSCYRLSINVKKTDNPFLILK